MTKEGHYADSPNERTTEVRQMAAGTLEQLLERGWTVAADVILNDPSVRKLTKDTLSIGMKKDCVDAVRDVELALEILRARRDYLLDRRA